MSAVNICERIGIKKKRVNEEGETEVPEKMPLEARARTMNKRNPRAVSLPRFELGS